MDGDISWTSLSVGGGYTQNLLEGLIISDQNDRNVVKYPEHWNTFPGLAEKTAVYSCLIPFGGLLDNQEEMLEDCSPSHLVQGHIGLPQEVLIKTFSWKKMLPCRKP